MTFFYCVCFAVPFKTVNTAEIKHTNDSSPEYNCRNCVYVLSKTIVCLGKDQSAGGTVPALDEDAAVRAF